MQKLIWATTPHAFEEKLNGYIDNQNAQWKAVPGTHVAQWKVVSTSIGSKVSEEGYFAVVIER